MRCSVCNKELTQYLKDESGRKYCSNECFKSEMPECSVCGKKMDSWITSEQGDKYCSDTCYSTILPKCNTCGKIMEQWIVSNESGHKYCCNKCFSEEFPICAMCGKSMKQWLTSNTSGKKYCNEECMSVEFPRCTVCGEPMQNWYETDDGSKYCSDACVSTIYPICETCLSPMTSWIEDEEGQQFCCQMCKDTDTQCRKITARHRSNRPSGAEVAGLVTGADAASNVYADQVLFNTGRRTLESGQRVQTGHGVAAERANNIMDRLTLQDAQLVGGDNAKHGPDRIVNDQEIQTKYYKTGRACVDACFDSKAGGKFKYLDSNGQPMLIEVPRDKYTQSLQRMEDKIREGKVLGVSDPEKAKDIVRKGWFTHNQAKNIVRFGTIESVTYDAVNGITVGVVSGGISSALSFAIAIWRGEDIKEAGKQAMYVGIKLGGQAFVTSVAVAQLGRTGVEQSLRGITNAATAKLGTRVCSVIAQGMGKSGLRGVAASNYVAKLLRGNIVTGVVVTVVFSAKDLFFMLDGQISFAQAFKNIATTAATIGGGYGGGVAGASAGCAVGSTVGSVIPIVGTGVGALIGTCVGFFGGGVAGGTAAGAVTNAALGLIIEDDAVALSKEFQGYTAALAESFVLSEGEVNHLSNQIQKMDLSKVLREMYATNNKRSWVASKIKPILVEITASRPPVMLPNTEQMLTYLEEFLEDAERDPVA